MRESGFVTRHELKEILEARVCGLSPQQIVEFVEGCDVESRAEVGAVALKLLPLVSLGEHMARLRVQPPELDDPPTCDRESCDPSATTDTEHDEASNDPAPAAEPGSRDVDRAVLSQATECAKHIIEQICHFIYHHRFQIAALFRQSDDDNW
jgi:hypothetical protein